MATVQDLASYLIPRAMAPREYVSLPRLIKLMYLADWREALACQSQITNVNWKIGSCGPSADEIYEQLRSDVTRFSISSIADKFGNPKTIVRCLTGAGDTGALTESQRAATDFILRIARNKPWESLTSLVSSTFPVATSETGAILNLPELAVKYQREVGPLFAGRKQ